MGDPIKKVFQFVKVKMRETQDYLVKLQVESLLKPLNAGRIQSRKGAHGKPLSYLGQEDVRAHLNRTFGFARWSADTIEAELMHSELLPAEPAVPAQGNRPAREAKAARWYVAHRVTLRLTINSPNGTHLATYTESAIAGNHNPEIHEAMDQSLKSATSDALKRCAINLGDQFGLSLYNKSDQRAPIVVNSLVKPEGDYGELEPGRGEAGEGINEIVSPPNLDDVVDAEIVHEPTVPSTEEVDRRVGQSLTHSPEQAATPRRAARQARPRGAIAPAQPAAAPVDAAALAARALGAQ